MVSPEMGRKLTGRVEAWRSAAQKREDAPDGNRAEPKLNPRQRAPCHLPRHPAHPSTSPASVPQKNFPQPRLPASLWTLMLMLRRICASYGLCFKSQQ